MPKIFQSETEIEIWLHENNIFYEENEKAYMKAYSKLEGFNERIRTGRVLLEEWKGLDLELSKMIKRNKLTEEITVYRGISKEAYRNMYKDAEITKGKRKLFSPRFLTERAYLSTSLIEGRELNSGIQLKIIVPKGTSFLYIGENSVSPEQTEMLFGKNIFMKELSKNGTCIETKIVSE